MQQKQSLHKRPVNGPRAQESRPLVSTPAGESSPASLFSLSSLPPAFPPAFPDRVRASTRRGILSLLALALCLEGCYLALYAVLAVPTIHDDALFRAWTGRFPLLARIYLLADRPIASLTAHLPWLQSDFLDGYAHVALILLGICLLLAVLAAWSGRRIGQIDLTAGGQRLLFWLLLVVSGLFALTFFWSPITLNAWTRDPLQSWLLGRLVIVQQVNPYATVLTGFTGDPALGLLQQTGAPTSLLSFGPVWADVCILITQIAPNNVVVALLGFRLLGLCALLVSVWLIWAILTRLKPAWRISGVVLFAWNPLVLLLAIGQTHHEMLAVMMVLLAIFFLLRNAPLLGWCFLLLAAMLSLPVLLLLPLCLRLLERETRGMSRLWRLGWWLSLLGLSALMMALAYLPYWQGWELTGIAMGIQQAFWQEQAINSFLAAFQGLPIHLPSNLSWLLTPRPWLILLMGSLLVCLLFSLWLVDRLELFLLSASWLFLLQAVLQPIYWPWLLLLPLALALCGGGGKTGLLAVLLGIGGLLCYYCWLWRPVWGGQGLLIIGVPCLLWGWIAYFGAIWQMTRRGHAGSSGEVEEIPSSTGLPRRPPWFSRPWPSRPVRRRV
jgi:hypothetical protein